MSTPKKVTELTESTTPQLTHYIPVHDGTGLKKVLLSAIKALMGSAAATWGSITGTLSNQTDLQNALNAKQNSLGFTPENEANKKISLADNSDTYYPSQKAVKTAVDAKQDTLVSGTNIKTINNTSLLGSGDITLASGVTINTTPITGGGSGRILFESATGKVSEDSNLTFISQQLTVNGQLNLGTGSIPSNTGVNNELQKYYSERVYKSNAALNISHKNNTFEMEFGSYYGDYFWYGVNSSFTGYSWGGNLNQQLFRIERTGNVGVNIYSPQARFHIIGTAEQLRIGYDGSNYLKVTVGSTGLVTYDAVGSGAGFKFMKPINLQNLPTSASGLSSGDVWNDSGTLKIV